MSKELLRKEMRALRDGFSDEYIEACSRKITAAFMESDIYKSSGAVMIYLSIGSEVRTDALLKKIFEDGKVCAVPVVRGKEIKISRFYKDGALVRSAFGIPEPEFPEYCGISGIDVIVIPALAYDARGYRIGYGGGYYDRLLSRVGSDIALVGFCYDKLIVDNIDYQPHDIKTEIVISDKRMIYNE